MDRFIAIEGADGVGKTTQVQRLVERLEREGDVPAVTAVRNPGGTQLAEKIREVAFGAIGADRSPRAMCHLMTAAAILAVEQVVVPALMDGEVVVCDRDVFASGPLYAGMSADSTAEKRACATYSREMLEFAGLRRPDLTILLDLPEDRALERKGRCRDAANRFDPRDRDAAHILRAGYLSMAHLDMGRTWAVVDASANEDVVADRVFAAATRGACRDSEKWPDIPSVAGRWVVEVAK